MNTDIEKKTIYYTVTSFIFFIYIFLLYKLPNDWFRDRDVYIIYAKHYDTFLQNDKSIKTFFNEPFFSQIAGIFQSNPDLFPTILSIFIATTYFIYTIKKSETFVTFTLGISLLTFNSYLIFQQIFQLRQGLATALFVIIFFSIKNIKARIILSSLLPFIHVAFFIISPIYILYEIYLKNIKTTTLIIYTATITTIFSIISISIMVALGFRQASLYESFNETKGGGSLILHIILCLYVYFYGDKKDTRLYNWVILGLVFFIFSYFIFPPSGRLFGSFYPFILLYLVSRSTTKNIIVLLILNAIFIYLFFSSSYLDMLTMDDFIFLPKLEKFITDLF
ncbi:EpsG family protein [Acinetobacter ursingii]|uniref:EpsG family protein n=1 Tax=Acinetobacter ursingii TaxID=108980 RepID=UPI00300B80E0